MYSRGYLSKYLYNFQIIQNKNFCNVMQLIILSFIIVHKLLGNSEIPQIL